jgi:hypothetical protein
MAAVLVLVASLLSGAVAVRPPAVEAISVALAVNATKEGVFSRTSGAGRALFAVTPGGKVPSGEPVFFEVDAGAYSTSGVSDGNATFVVGIRTCTPFWGELDHVENFIAFIPERPPRPTLPSSLVVSPATLVTTLTYQTADQGDAAVLIGAKLFNPYYHACVNDPPVVITSAEDELPWLPPLAAEAINCTHEHRFRSLSAWNEIYAVLVHIQDDESGDITAYRMTDYEGLGADIYYYEDGDENVLIAATTDGLLGYAESAIEAIDGPSTVVAIDVYTAMTVYSKPITTAMHIRYRFTPVPEGESSNFEFNVWSPGSFLWSAAPVEPTPADEDRGTDIVVIEVEPLFANASLPTTVAFAVQFAVAEDFETETYCAPQDAIPVPEDLVRPYYGQLAMRVADYTTFRELLDAAVANTPVEEEDGDYFAYMSPNQFEACSELMGAFGTPLGLQTGVVLLNATAALGTPFTLVSIDRVALYNAFVESTYIDLERQHLYCFYAVFPVVPSDFVNNSSEPLRGRDGIPFRMRPSVLQLVEFRGDADAHNARASTGLVSSFHTVPNDGMFVVNTTNHTIADALKLVMIDNVRIDSGPEDCAVVYGRMLNSTRAHFAALNQTCSYGGDFDGPCAYLTEAVGLLDAPPVLPEGALCPQLSIEPMYASRAVSFGYFFPYENLTGSPTVGEISLLVAVDAYDPDLLCGYAQRTNFEATPENLRFTFAATTTVGDEPESNLTARRMLPVVIVSYFVSYDDLGCNEFPIVNQRFIPGAPAGVNQTAICQGELHASLIYHVPVLGVSPNALFSLAMAEDAEERLAAASALVTSRGAIGACDAALIASLYECEGDLACIDASLHVAPCIPVPQRKVALGLDDYTEETLADRLFYYGRNLVTVYATSFAFVVGLSLLLL